MSIPRSISYLGVGKEARHAAGVLPTAVVPTNFIPFMSISPFDNIAMLTDEGIRGSMIEDYGSFQGKIFSELEFGGNLFADSFGWALAGILGDVTTTGSASVAYSHAMSLLNTASVGGQPIPYSFWDYQGLTPANTCRYFAGTQITEVGIKFAAEESLQFTAKGVGYQSIASVNPTPIAYSSVTPIPSWCGSASVAGASTVAIQEGEINFKRNVDVIETVNGSQAPYQVFVGDLVVDGSLTLIYEASTWYDYYLNNTQPAFAVNFAQGSGASQVGLNLQMSKLVLTDTKIDRGQKYVSISTSIRGAANTTDIGASGGYSPVKATLKNALPSGTYV